MTTSQGDSAERLDSPKPVKISIRNLNFFYGKFQALKDINLDIKDRTITAIIGPSGCGKSTLLRAINRMNDLIEAARTTGEVHLDGRNIYDRGTDLVELRRKVGMVFQRPNPFPLSIFENVAYGPLLHRRVSRSELAQIVERSLEQTGLWAEVKDVLNRNALLLTPEQQQRLCISRLVAVEPEVLLMDEPCSALDPIATGRIEELMQELKEDYCIVIVTHNMQQAARVSDETGFMLLGELVEFQETQAIFTRPKDRRTEDYITGRYG